MLRRCYDTKYHIKYPTYQNCIVCDKWHNFQNFGKWYNENYYEIPNSKMNLDKDLLVYQNKIYSDTTCCFLPNSINELLTRRDARRGEFPIGVYRSHQSEKFLASCDNGEGEKVYLGYYKNEIDAFMAYKKYKEMLCKQLANKYKDFLPMYVYNALLRYTVQEMY
jgi:hypothetical protein